MTDIILATENLVKSYAGSDRPAINGLSLQVDRGQIFGLLGPNGAGKTTTISILCTLLQPSSGSATILGHDVVRQATEVRRNIGLVPQDIALYGSLTARENLRYFARIYKISAKLIEERINECLQLAELQDCADRRVSTYSGGMKRRANLAAGILHQPEILFLDEPTVGIDAQSRNLILERLVELNHQGVTLIYTTHYMEEAQQICDQVAIVDGGQMIACGHPTQLVNDSPGCGNLEGLFLQLTGKQLRDRVE
ncbi:ABC-2 type transport system ATP-binding protein [Desulfuromusa kysingii]|uniref:ABC-2 type transport system ATP-binding protein n=1 Tax=Desulfuromusa kysingii TaxID=37625 RepID=A0A1H3VPV9_9BACT|nr:ATP-binding cassette domain-containing protein [Desulfuromusa kysingii]SDZ76837.1 ABC-2 type transport system ATP-binding protein [Desulfuromusa kysingii]